MTRPPESAAPSVSPASRARGPLGGATSAGPLIVVALLLLAVVVGAIAFAAWRRVRAVRSRADGAYGMVTRLAARLGFGPRPEQTVYEYAGALGELLPDARPELQTVATAKVEVGLRRPSSSGRTGCSRCARRSAGCASSLLRLAVRALPPLTPGR